jgi:hypothetical protein
MRIAGANLEEREVDFINLVEYAEPGTKFYEVMEYLQNFYYDCFDKAENSFVNKFPVEGDSVVIEPMMINHRCRADIDILREISKRGVLASEWFGIPESEGEARFCTFVDRIKPECYEGYEKDNFRRFNTNTQEIILFFDQENEIMKKLLSLDFFEYQKIKRDNPEKLDELFTDKEIELLDIILEFSKASYDFRDKKNRPYYYWSAIPGGIPSSLVNGVCIKLDDYTDEYLDEVGDLFPNATLFSTSFKVLRDAKVNSSNEVSMSR